VVGLPVLLRSNQFYLIPLALVIVTGPTGSSSARSQIAHVLIYDIRIDDRISANDWVSPIIARDDTGRPAPQAGLLDLSRNARRRDARASAERPLLRSACSWCRWNTPPFPPIEPIDPDDYKCIGWPHKFAERLKLRS
jgi:hypothetical protein